MKTFEELCEELSNDIKNSYESGVSLEVAERHAAKFLHGQIQVSEKLKDADLDARMKRTGVKAVKAAVYMDEATKGDKKPSDAFLQNLVDLNALVQKSQDTYDTAEVYKDQLQNYFNIFKEAHIYFRGIAKGSF